MLLLIFSTIWGIALVKIIFSIKKGNYLANRVSSNDSVTINLWSSVIISFFELDSKFVELFVEIQIIDFYHL